MRGSFLFANFPNRFVPVHLKHPEAHAHRVVFTMTLEHDSAHRILPVECDITFTVSGQERLWQDHFRIQSTSWPAARIL
jgi:hypothetical protein